MKRIFCLILLALGSAAALSAQTSGFLSGRVTDANTGLALEGVRVSVAGSTASTFTGSDGRYTLGNVEPGGNGPAMTQQNQGFLAALFGDESSAGEKPARSNHGNDQLRADPFGGDFFGRDRLIARFVDVLERPGSAGRLLAVVGPSGSGKSSAVRSGLLPLLRAGGVSGSDDWFITTMVPGNHPFEELESALSRVAVRQAE